VRGAAGALFRVPLVVAGAALSVLDRLGARGLRRLGTVARGGVAYDEVDLRDPVAIVLGSEAHGLAADVAAAVDTAITIPMAGSVESLNVAVAGAVVCFEVARQRRADAR
jgi:tRNA G18 (ribose-2'-O)-methylase SpoU